MRILVILILLLLIAIFLKPSKFKKFFFVYALSIGIIGFSVYEGNRYLNTRSSSEILPSQVGLEDFRMDTTLQLFLKGKIVNKADKGVIKELTLRLTVHEALEATNQTGPGIFGVQEFTVVTRIGPDDSADIIQKVSIPGLDTTRIPPWKIEVVSVKTALW
jgi:hypothetical protein